LNTRWRYKTKKTDNHLTVSPIDLKIGMQCLGPRPHVRLWGHWCISKNMAAISQWSL